MIPQPHETLLNSKKVLEESYIKSLREINPFLKWRAFPLTKTVRRRRKEKFFYRVRAPSRINSLSKIYMRKDVGAPHTN